MSDGYDIRNERIAKFKAALVATQPAWEFAENSMSALRDDARKSLAPEAPVTRKRRSGP
jgi:hypothetical protein